MKKRVLISSFYNREAVAPALAKLAQHAEVVTGNNIGRSFTEEEIINALKGIDAVIAAEEPYNARVFESAPQLLMIARDGVGLNNIDICKATEYGVVVNNAPVVHESVADLAMGLIIAAVRKIGAGDKGMRAGQWTDRDRYLCPDVNGKTLGLLGFGRIAQAVARRAAGFNMKILAHDICPDPVAAEKLGVRMVAMDELLKNSDILSIHTPLTPQTSKFINRETIGKMKDGAYLVNTSRGEVVDETALIEALKAGKIAGAGLDVVCGEPPDAGNQLFMLDNVVFTPHVGSDTCDTFLKVYESAVDDILLLFSGDEPRNIINREVLKHKKFKKCDILFFSKS